jgi:hypothetical protein
VAVGAETSARQRLARDADRARFGCKNWEHAGRENKFGGTCKWSDELVVSVPRIFFCPKPPNRRLFCSSRLFGESARVGEWCFGSQVHMLPIFKCNI